MKAVFETIGFDVDRNKIGDLKEGKTISSTSSFDEVMVPKSIDGFKASADYSFLL